MKTVLHKQSIAWFKLAECVDRGEKEKALAFHRLLTHSFTDHAFIKKLEGDILAFFQDNHAHSVYEQAADLYFKQEKLFEAAMIYEYLLLLHPDHVLYKQKVVTLFQELGHHEKVCRYESHES